MIGRHESERLQAELNHMSPVVDAAVAVIGTRDVRVECCSGNQLCGECGDLNCCDNLAIADLRLAVRTYLASASAEPEPQ